MPPKKKVPARRASGKHVRISETSIIAPTRLSPSGRRMRRASMGLHYKVTATRAPNGSPLKKLAKQSKDVQDKNDITAAIPKRRGRPPAATAAPAAKIKSTATATKPGRGRPRKIIADPPSAPQSATTTTPKSSKRKREAADEVRPAVEPPKKRGRPAKVKIDVEPTATKTAPKATKKEAQKVVAKSASSQKNLVQKVDVPAKSTTASAPGRKGRPPGSKNLKPKIKDTATTTASNAKAKSKSSSNKAAVADTVSEEEIVEGLTQPEQQGTADVQYWLMKAEPDTRIEKGVDVAYPIDKLAAATEPEPWDGVRNAVARNNMRSMRKGDLAFFYHSNTSNPGIVGVMRIAEEHSIDESAFDPTHPYYDEKSDRSKPKWDCVKVEFVKKFSDLISLKTLKSTAELSGMQLVQKAYGRLSVQSVRPAEWAFVLKMANEAPDVGVGDRVSGYEADTNGETDREAEESEGIAGVDGDADVDKETIAKYGRPDDHIDGERQDGLTKSKVNGDMDIDLAAVEKEHDRVEAIDAFAKEITSGGDV